MDDRLLLLNIFIFQATTQTTWWKMHLISGDSKILVHPFIPWPGFSTWNLKFVVYGMYGSQYSILIMSRIILIRTNVIHSNPVYGDGAYTKLTPALVRELGSWVGLGRFNTGMRWLPSAPTDFTSGEAAGFEDGEHPHAVPNRNNLFLHVDEEHGSRLYLKRGSGSPFDVSFMGLNIHLISL